MQVNLPIHQPSCDQKLLYGINPFLLNNYLIINHIKHLNNAIEANHPFGNPGKKTVPVEVIHTIGIKLTRYQLMQKSFRVFVVENSLGHSESASKMPVKLVHQHDRNQLMGNALYQCIFQRMGKRTMTYIM